MYKSKQTTLYYYMDETSSPFETREYSLNKDDIEFKNMILNKYHLEKKENDNDDSNKGKSKNE